MKFGACSIKIDNPNYLSCNIIHFSCTGGLPDIALQLLLSSVVAVSNVPSISATNVPLVKVAMKQLIDSLFGSDVSPIITESECVFVTELEIVFVEFQILHSVPGPYKILQVFSFLISRSAKLQSTCFEDKSNDTLTLMELPIIIMHI